MSHERSMHPRPTRDDSRDAESTDPLDVGDDVEVFSGYERTWASGFSIARVLGGRRYRLRRSSDDALLPEPTGARDLRRRPHREQW